MRRAARCVWMKERGDTLGQVILGREEDNTQQIVDEPSPTRCVFRCRSNAPPSPPHMWSVSSLSAVCMCEWKSRVSRSHPLTLFIFKFLVRCYYYWGISCLMLRSCLYLLHLKVESGVVFITAACHQPVGIGISFFVLLTYAYVCF